MRCAWLNLAWVAIVASGCFGSHDVDADAGRPPPPIVDAGPPVAVDAGPLPADSAVGVCRELDGQITSMTCLSPPRPGEAARVELETAPTQCCSTGAPRARSRAVGGDFQIDVEWTACDCCEACRCLGPLQTLTLDLGVLSPGRHVVRAGGSACEIVVPDDAACSPIDASLRMPRHVFTDQTVPLTLTSGSFGGCSCRPQASTARSPGGVEVGLEVCDCCDGCECVDPGYQASAVLEPFAVGHHEVAGPAGDVTLAVHAPGSCQPADATDVEILPPSSTLLTSGPRLTWMRVRGTSVACCAPPSGAIAERADGGYDLVDCLEFDCDCVGSPRDIDAWYSLGELAAGDYTVRVDGVTRAFSVD